MREIPITAFVRRDVGKGSARKTRQAGKIPAVVYGPEIDPVPVAVEEHEFRSAMRNATSSTILNLQIEDKENKVVLRDIQRDPVTSRVIHVDFHAISMDKPISISIPIRFVGIARGVKTDGGIMQATMRELEISCLPVDIPDQLEVDVTDLGIGDSIHVRDLEIPKVDIQSEARRTVVVISAPTVIKAVEVEEEVEEVEGEAAEGEAAEGEAAEGEATESKAAEGEAAEGKAATKSKEVKKEGKKK